MAAKESRLGELHEMLADLFIEDIRICKEEGIPMSASDKAVIAKFLKDNSITCDVDAQQLQTLNDEFKDELNQRREARKEKLRLQQEGGDTDLLAGLL